MIDIDALFPSLDALRREAFEAAPRRRLLVSSQVEFQKALELDDPRYEPTSRARAERFQLDFYNTLGHEPNDEFAPQGEPKHVLFFGHVGCGKSTELRHLCKELHHPGRYWVVRVDVLSLLDSHDTRYTDVWLAVAQRLVEELDGKGIAIDPQAMKRLLVWFDERVLSNEQIRDFSAEVKSEASVGAGLPLIGALLSKFTAAIRIGSTHREAIRTVVRNTYGAFVDALNLLISDATQTIRRIGQGHQLLFVIDGTDRLRGEDWKRFFVDDANQLTQVRCVAVYTAPMALKSSGSRLDLFASVVLPMVKLREIDRQGIGAPRPQAYATMRAILLKRCHHSLFDGVETLDRLIDHSGGHLRDALRLLAYACVAATSNGIGAAEVDKAAMRLASDYRDWLGTNDYTVLAEASRRPENHGGSESITRLVEAGALLEYNHGAWRLPHPVVRLLPGYAAAAAALLAVAGALPPLPVPDPSTPTLPAVSAPPAVPLAEGPLPG